MTTKTDVKVTVTYKKDIITITGDGIEAKLMIEGKELKKLYWSGKGSAKLTANIA